MDIRTFVRKPFDVEAVRVTMDNMHEVAAWCEGDVKFTKTKDGVEREAYVKVDVKRPLNEKQTRAFCGDWVLKTENGCKVYTNRAMERNFDAKLVYTEADAQAQLED